MLIGPGKKGDKPGANALKRTRREEIPGNPRFETAQGVIQQLLARNARQPAARASAARFGRKLLPYLIFSNCFWTTAEPELGLSVAGKAK
jgi:hypothetical protein